MNMGAYLHVQPRLQRCMEVRAGWGPSRAAGCAALCCHTHTLQPPHERIVNPRAAQATGREVPLRVKHTQ